MIIRRKFLGKILRKSVYSLTVLAVIFSSLGPVFTTVRVARAAITGVVVATAGLPNQNPNAPIPASSVAMPIAKITINVDADTTLTSIAAFFGGTGFVAGDLAALATNASSGVAIYNDAGGGNLGTFGAGDTLIPVTLPGWTSTSVTLSPSGVENLLAIGGNTYYVVIKTSAGATNGHLISATFPTSNPFPSVVTAAGSSGPASDFTTNNYIVDTVGPTISTIEKISPNAVEVAFSEIVQTGAATTKTNYTFTNNPALTVIDAVQQGPNYKIVASGDITAGATTLTVNANILDLAGNANTETMAQAISVPVKVKISEVVPEIGVATSEFVELYNSGGESVDISGWKLQYSAANPVSWATIATIPDSTTLAQNKFYLIATADFNIASPPETDGNTEMTAGLTLIGGHLRLTNGAVTTEFDKIGWGTATSPEGTVIAAPATNQSLERKAFGSSSATAMATGGADAGKGNGWDTNNNSFDFVAQTIPNSQNFASTAEIPQFGGGGGGGGMGAPMINHMPINIAPSGAALEIIAQMGDPMTPIDQMSAELHYIIGDGNPTDNLKANYTTVLGVHQSNGYFKFTVPQATVDNASTITNGLYYYLKLITNGGTKFMSSSPTVDTASVGLGLTYADFAAQEVAVARYPFNTNVDVSDGWTKRNITGTIKDGAAVNVEGALVFLEGTGYNTATAANGTFTLANVKEGIYNLIIVKSGFFEGMVNNILLNGADKSMGIQTINSGTGGGMTGDNTKPMVNWSGPPDGMFGISTQDAGFKIFIGFSKDLDPATFIPTNVFLTTNGSDSIVSAVNYDPADRTNMPQDPYLGVVYPPTVGGFTANTTYYLVMNGNVRDTSGNSLQGNRPEGGHVISFTTGGSFTQDQMMGAGFGSGAMMPPFVMGVTPSDGAMNIVTNAKINISFSDPMDSASVNTTNIKLYKITVSGTTEIKTPVTLSAVALDTSGKVATLTPSGVLDAGKHRVVVTGALKSATGIWMGNPGANPVQNTATYEFYKSAFEVGTSSDATAPTVLGSWPADNAVNISVNPGMLTVQFSEGMSPSTINSNSITLKRGTSSVTGNVNYDSMSQSASFSPSVVLATSADYTFTVTTGATDAVGTALAQNYVVTFTTGATGDTSAPSIMFANGDEYGVAITFSEAMNAAKITDTTNWTASVLKSSNFVIKQGPANTSDWAAGAGVTTLVLSGAKFNYDAMGNTVTIDGLSVTFIGNDYYIDMSSSVAKDLSGNLISAGTPDTFRMPINSSATTNGMLGPMMGGGMGGPMGPSMGNMGMMKAGVFPMNAMAGQTTVYFVDVPTTKIIPSGGKIVLIFPTGFDVTSAAKDAFSPVNNDINEWNAGTVTIASVAADQAARKITITTGGAATQANDFLHMDIKGIINSSIPRGFETSGYSVDMKTMDASGNLLETITGMPFFINAGGSSTLTGSITGIQADDVDGAGDTVKVFLGSPMTGPMEAIATIVDAGTGSYSFSNLTQGQYMIFTDPTITLDSNDYAGMQMPQSIAIGAGANTKNIALVKQAAGGGNATITVNLTGNFSTGGVNDNIDIFAGSPSGFKVKTVNPNTDDANDAAAGSLDNTDDNSITQYVFYLPAGNWMVGVGPAMPKGPMSGPPPMPDWMPPMPNQIVSDGVTSQTVNISISTASKQIIGYVQDASGIAIADAEAFAYQPMGTGTGAHGKTDTNGKFTLKVAADGIYSVGVFKPGLPGVPDRTVKVGANTGAVDGNSTADIMVDGAPITEVANKFVFKIQKSSTTISGKVTNGTDPVSFAPVWASQTGATGHADTMTDSAGNYILYVGNGTWTVQSYVPGYGDSTAQTVVVNGSSMTQNLSPATSASSFKTISGTITINGAVQTFMPVRAVQYNDSAVYTGKEFGGQTDSLGVYKISVPIGKYRVDTWTPEYGEVELSTDGVLNSPANINVSGNVVGANITIAADNLKTITLAFTNGIASQTGIVDIDGVLAGKPTGFHKTIKLSALNASSSVKLATGSYMFQMNVPGVGFITPVGNPITVSDTLPLLNTVTFALPNSATEIFTVSGTITGPGAIGGAWVWMGNPTTGVHFGTTTATNGTYSLAVKAGTYNMGVEMPGFIPQSPTVIAVAADAPATNYTLTAANQFITGKIYADANSNNSWDSGEGIANGWVFAEETTTKKIAGAPTDINGLFSLGVGNGTYILRGAAEGYSETKYADLLITTGAGDGDNNIKLTVDANWSSKLKSKPMTPASGGTMDDSLSTGTGVKLVVPPNALGSGTSSGNIKTNEISSVSKTSSAQPLGSKGKEITAQDNSGQAITSLNDDIEIELNYYKADIVEADVQDMGKLDLLTNSYWDASVSDWVPMSTTKKAYTKINANDTEWTAESSFSEFVDDLQVNPDAFGDYKITLQSTSDHLTIFGATIPSDLTAPAAPTGLSQTSGSGTSVLLDWVNNSEADVLEYEVYRSTSSGVASIDANQKNTSQLLTSAFTDSTTVAWTSYYYTVTAVDDSGNESAVATEIRACSNSAVANGTVANTCAITCNSGYTLSGNSCSANSTGGGGVSVPTSSVTNASISIANGTASTAGVAVNLILSATNATQMAIANTADFAGAAWETFAISKSWILTLNDGLKTVYAKFRDAAGVASGTVSDTITLGNIAPTPTPVPAATPTPAPLPGPATPSANSGVTLYRADGDNKVYVVKNNIKQWIKTAEEFIAAGYKWSDIVVTTPAAVAAYSDGTIAIVKVKVANTSTLRVRKSNTTASAILGKVKKNETFTVLEEKSGWYKIATSDGAIGWISGAYTAPAEENNSNVSSGATITINTSLLRFRSVNGTSGKVLGVVRQGEKYSVLEEKAGWYKIQNAKGVVGWVLGSYTIKR